MTAALNAPETCAELVDPALTEAGMGRGGPRIRREVTGPLAVTGGKPSSKQDIAAYCFTKTRGSQLSKQSDEAFLIQRVLLKQSAVRQSSRHALPTPPMVRASIKSTCTRV